jgi:putative membrane protein
VIESEHFLDNPYLSALVIFSVAVLVLIVFLTVFELVTKYNDWQEIKAGNLSVAMATGGKIFGICNVFHYAIQNNESIGHALIWSGFGFVLLLISYFIFEFLTPYFKIDEEIKKDNRAVGFLAMVISVSISFVIGACVP